jgi:two-component system, NtrC family, sensor histidine kinase HydH
MNLPLHLPPVAALDSRAAPPFNLSRWFAIVGLASIAAIATISALLLSNFLTERMLRLEGQTTMQFLQSLMMTERSLGEYFTGARTRDAKELEAALRHVAALPDTLRANIYNVSRKLIWSTDKELVGRQFGANPELDAALSGTVVVHGDAEEDIDRPRKEEHVDLHEGDEYFIEVYVPVRTRPDGDVIGVVELYKSPHALAQALRAGRLYIFIGAAAASVFLYLTLFGLARRADAIIGAQRKRLVESEILATVGEMGSAVAHGIRNPLAAIRSSAELALDGSPGSVRESAQDIIAEADRLEAWVRNLLSYSRPLSVAHESVALPEVVEGAVSHFAREMEKREIAGCTALAQDLPRTPGDAFLLGQVLHNLLANAIEAIQHSGTIEIAGRALFAQKRVELTVRDSGPGMSREQLERVFTPFYTTKPSGLGVGLALTKRIIERFGGSISIDSAPGRGTTVRLSMPIA